MLFNIMFCVIKEIFHLIYFKKNVRNYTKLMKITYNKCDFFYPLNFYQSFKIAYDHEIFFNDEVFQ